MPINTEAAGTTVPMCEAEPVAVFPDSAASQRFTELLSPKNDLAGIDGASGLARLVADNAALGEALKSLVDGIDTRPMTADCRPIASESPRAVEMPVVAGAPKVAAEAPRAVETPVVAGVPKVAAEAPRAVETPVVAGVPKVAAEAPRAVETPVGVETPKAIEVEKTIALPKDSGMVAVVEEPVVVKTGVSVKAKAEVNHEEPEVILQAVPISVAPAADIQVSVVEKGARAVEAVTPVAPVDVDLMFETAASEVASAVYVSPELKRGEAGEIRVQLRPDVLEGSEVVVAVDGRKMSVTFVPSAASVAETVASNQSVLQTQLAAKIDGFEISVAVAQGASANVAAVVGSATSASQAVSRGRRTNGRA